MGRGEPNHIGRDGESQYLTHFGGIGSGVCQPPPAQPSRRGQALKVRWKLPSNQFGTRLSRTSAPTVVTPSNRQRRACATVDTPVSSIAVMGPPSSVGARYARIRSTSPARTNAPARVGPPRGSHRCGPTAPGAPLRADRGSGSPWSGNRRSGRWPPTRFRAPRPPAAADGPPGCRRTDGPSASGHRPAPAPCRRR